MSIETSSWTLAQNDIKWPFSITTENKIIDKLIVTIFNNLDRIHEIKSKITVFNCLKKLNQELKTVDVTKLAIRTLNIPDSERFIEEFKESLDKVKNKDCLIELEYEYELDNVLLFNDFSPLIHLLGIAKESAKPMYIIDESTDDYYLNESDSVIRLKILGVALATPITHTITPLTIAGSKLCNGKIPSLEDLGRILFSPITVSVIEISALMGVFSPLEARKSIATIEKQASVFLAPCFQPSPTHHGLGGDIHTQDAW